MNISEGPNPSAVPRCDFVRCLQLAMCISCLSLCLSNLQYKTLNEIVVYLLMTTVSSSYTLLVTIDVLSRLSYKLSVHFKLWAIYGFIGAPLFIFCPIIYVAVLSIPENFQVPLMLSLFVLAGISFFWDSVCILFFRKYKITPRNDSESETDWEEPVSKEIEKVNRLCEENEIETTQESSYNDKYQNFAKRGQRRCKMAITYGGTFHVSKNMPPLPSPKIIPLEELSMISEKSEDINVREDASANEDFKKHFHGNHEHVNDA